MSSPTDVEPPDVVVGLTDEQVVARVQRGLTNDVPAAPSRGVAQILRSNLLTRFNALLGGLLVGILLVGEWRDALFGLVLVANSGIGIVQELRAKRALDRLAVLSAPLARVVRAGGTREVHPSEIVQDDVLEMRPGDQIVVDGEVLASDGLEVDETLLTGESDAVVRTAGGSVLSGSFVVAGSGLYRATRVGGAAYAARLTADARSFTLFDSRLRAEIDVVLRLATWALLPAAAILVISQLRAQATVEQAVASSIGGVVAMVPEGLVLLTSTAFAVAVVRLARQRTLVQELAAVEGLARADVLCLDKTGTLTRGAITFAHLDPLGGHNAAATVLGAIAAVDANPNATLRAIAAQFPAPAGWNATQTVAFSSTRGYAVAAFGARGAWVLGAPEVLLARTSVVGDIAERVTTYVEDGQRVLMLARVPDGRDLTPLPSGLQACALVVLADHLRPDAPAVLDALTREDIAIKVISGDDPRTVGALARRAGLGQVVAVDARGLPDDGPGLVAAIESATVFGRVAPRQKLAMVAALQSVGHVVAMTGDGVNDVLALKGADLGIAMGSGSAAARGVAQLVLLDDQFSALPSVLAEGRRVIGNVDRLARLFVTKSVYSLLLALAVGVAVLPFPFLPRHLSLIGALTIGIPGVFLAVAPNTGRVQDGFLTRVLRFAVPAGMVAAAATFAGYYVTRLLPDVNLDEARTTATVVLLSVGLIVLARLADPLTRARRLLITGLVVMMILAVALPTIRTFFALDPPPPIVMFAAIGIVAICERLLGVRGAGLLSHRPAMTATPHTRGS